MEFCVTEKNCNLNSDPEKSPENLNNKKDYCPEETRREFLYLTTAGFGVVAAASIVSPLVKQMLPDKSVLALSSTEVNLSSIPLGTTKTVKWRGKPVFIKHRTPEQITEMKDVALSDLRDPQSDADRTKVGNEDWLVVVGSCTHLGCVPSSNMGEFEGGWYCPCHGSHYDAAGRIRKGPAPTNLVVPEYEFIEKDKIVIG
ncbi:MAG: ubiquinol-cytochrome c reductase iron-sulfur subunit [Alphaproteobacteria bacterium]|jgi:ubiquinol-cytochrome c reductase iron-sulfur subunit